MQQWLLVAVLVCSVLLSEHLVKGACHQFGHSCFGAHGKRGGGGGGGTVGGAGGATGLNGGIGRIGGGTGGVNGGGNGGDGGGKFLGAPSRLAQYILPFMDSNDNGNNDLNPMSFNPLMNDNMDSQNYVDDADPINEGGRFASDMNLMNRMKIAQMKRRDGTTVNARINPLFYGYNKRKLDAQYMNLSNKEKLQSLMAGYRVGNGIGNGVVGNVGSAVGNLGEEMGQDARKDGPDDYAERMAVMDLAKKWLSQLHQQE